MRTKLLILLSVVLLASCNKKKETTYTRTYNCANYLLVPYFPDYNYAEASSVIYRTYFKDSTFDSLISENVYPIDSFNGDYNVLHDVWPGPDYDYEIILPVVNDTYRISQITMLAKTETLQHSSSDKSPHSNCLKDFHISDLLISCNSQQVLVNLTLKSPGNFYYMRLKK